MAIRLKVINPNTTGSMTRHVGEAARAVAPDDVEVDAVSPAMGPVSIEGHYDEALAAIGVLDEVRQGEAEGVDGYVIACFGDPGLQAARELATGPVVGIAEAAFHAASFVGRSFAIVTTLERTLGRARDLVDSYGFSRQCVAYRACEVPVLGLEEDFEGSYEALRSECLRSLAEDGPDAIVLGCAGMAAMCGRLEDELQIPVIDGVAAGTMFAAALVRIGVGSPSRGEFAPPLPKRIDGILRPFELNGGQ
ncbi:aspartate/glutamate racemase family protein [uncultured Bifidobacterium sp.]|uniref:aspartate/glutamate racemase family protein n=1 Tax=uncultured Bifidobacterium sp. TaxID=165187 RepID=UPI00260E1ACA|nr:aspartate/glutamate racemase family protein [uncultured Bifidobacterium sp.]